jgi:hypothetical protein
VWRFFDRHAVTFKKKPRTPTSNNGLMFGKGAGPGSMPSLIWTRKSLCSLRRPAGGVPCGNRIRRLLTPDRRNRRLDQDGPTLWAIPPRSALPGAGAALAGLLTGVALQIG